MKRRFTLKENSLSPRIPPLGAGEPDGLCPSQRKGEAISSEIKSGNELVKLDFYG
jgi:hypothetical protein